MTDSSQLSVAGVLWLSALVLLFGADLYFFVSKRDPLAIYQPPVFVIGFMSYYCLVGPAQRLISNDWVDRLTDFQSSLPYGWAGAVIFYASFRLGYGLLRSWKPNRRFSPPFDSQRAASLGQSLCLIGTIFFLLANGLQALALLNPFAVTQSPFWGFTGLDFGPFANYANTAINLLIPGVLLIFAGWVKRRGNPTGLVIWTLIALALFTSLGFRWRIITLLVPMLLLWFLARGRRPGLPALTAAVLGLLLLAGFIGLTRTYGAGLELADQQSFELSDVLTASLDESSVFLTTAGIIENTPANQPFVGFSPIVSTLLYPIPSGLLDQEKGSAAYLLESISKLYGVENLGIGAAILNYAEYYLMFGWISVVVIGLLSGGLLRTLWNWFTIRRHETLAQVAYVATCGLLYVWISRGYMPQVVLSFAFGSLPLFWLYYRQSVRRVPVLSTPLSQQP